MLTDYIPTEHGRGCVTDILGNNTMVKTTLRVLRKRRYSVPIFTYLKQIFWGGEQLCALIYQSLPQNVCFAEENNGVPKFTNLKQIFWGGERLCACIYQSLPRQHSYQLTDCVPVFTNPYLKIFLH